MSRHTTYRIGGPASLYITCDTVSDLSLVLEVLAEEEVPWTVVGKGSNLLVSDEGYQGAVIALGREFSRIDFGGYGEEDADAAGAPAPSEVVVTAGAAVNLSRLVTKAFGLGLSGLGFAVGTPGTVGGAVRMNAGTATEWLCSVIECHGLHPRQGSVQARGRGHRLGLPLKLHPQGCDCCGGFAHLATLR